MHNGIIRLLRDGTLLCAASSGAGESLRRAFERFDLQVGCGVLEAAAGERLLEEFRIGLIDVDDEPLSRGVEMYALDRGERCGMQQSLRRLAWLFDVLIQDSCGIVRGFDHKRIA